MIDVVLVDDHELVRAGFRMLLSQQADIEIVGEAPTAEEGLALIRKKLPAIALVDVHMPGMGGLELTERVLRARLRTKIIVITAIQDTHFSRRLLEAGAHGYLTKNCGADELVEAVHKVASGHRYLGEAVARQLAMATLEGDKSPFADLSDREMEVAMLLAQGKGLTTIGQKLSLSPKTVSTYKQRLMKKLQVDQVVSLAYLMAAHGLIEKPTPAAP
jgi:two-component system, NarL family, invasion response regulator UvrY